MQEQLEPQSPDGGNCLAKLVAIVILVVLVVFFMLGLLAGITVAGGFL